MVDQERPSASLLGRLASWRGRRQSRDWNPTEPEAGGRGAAFGIVLGLIIAIAFWTIVALLVF